jgi:hypothetical protein
LDTPRPVDTAVFCALLSFLAILIRRAFSIFPDPYRFHVNNPFPSEPLVQTKLQIPQQICWFPYRLSDCFQSGLTGDQHPKSLSIWSKGLFKHLHNKPRHCRHANDAQQRPRLSSISIIPLRKMSIKAKPRHSSSTSLRSILPVHPYDSGAATETQQLESAIAKAISNIERLSQEAV